MIVRLFIIQNNIDKSKQDKASEIKFQFYIQVKLTVNLCMGVLTRAMSKKTQKDYFFWKLYKMTYQSEFDIELKSKSNVLLT